MDPAIEVEMVVGTPRGGGQDRAARALAAAIESAGGGRVTISNLPGRGGGVAWSRVAAGTAGHTISIGSPTLLTNAIADPGEPGVGQFTHLAILCSEEIAFVASRSRGPATAGDLLDRFASQPDSLLVAVATALGNVNHLAVAAVARAAGADPRDLRVEAHDAARLAVEAVVSGRAAVAAVSLASVLDALRAGMVTLLARSAPRDSAPFEGVPTWPDLGVDCELVTWRSVVGPAGLGNDLVAFWDRLLPSAVKHPAWRAALDDFYWTDRYAPSTEAAAFVAGEDRRLRHLASGLGVELG